MGVLMLNEINYSGGGSESQSASIESIAPIEQSTTASQAYSIGDLLFYDDVLYKVTSAIAQGGTIIISGASANIIQTDIDTELKNINNTIPTIDTTLSPTSENPVQNKIVKGALDTKVPISLVGVANGLAELDANGKVPASQLPSYVDDVIEGYYKTETDRFYEDNVFTTVITPIEGKSWVDIPTNKSYRWTGSVYVRVDEGVQLGETSDTAYAGSKGKANAEAIAAIKNGTSINSFNAVEQAIDLVVKSSNLSSSDFSWIMGNTQERTYLSSVFLNKSDAPDSTDYRAITSMAVHSALSLKANLSDYDPDGTVAAAGGIVDYIDDVIINALRTSY